MIKTGNRISNKTGNKFLVALLLLFSLSAAAQVKVQSFVDRNEMGLGDTVTLTVAVTSGDSFEASEPRLPNLEGFNLVNSWNSSRTSSKLVQTSSGMQFETVREQDFNYMLTPTKTGQSQVAAFEVVVDGKTYYTKPVLVKVLKQGSGSAQQQQVPGMPGLDDIDEADQLFQQLLSRRGRLQAPPANKQKAINPNESFFVRLELDKTSAYEGEQITANWYIYTRGNILSLDRVKFPDLKGFWKEIIEEVPVLNFEQEVLNGVAYRRALLASHALFPIKAGTATIDAYKIKASVQVPNGPFGFGPTYSLTRVSDRVNINVKPLPMEGRPKNFTGAVGQFEMTATVDGQSFPANQPFSLKVRFDGVGNAKTIELPHIDLPPGAEIYDTKSDSKFFKNGHSYKEFEVLIIPRQAGNIVIPALSASMFNPSTKHYYSRSTKPITIKISPAVNAAPGLSNRIQGDVASPLLAAPKNQLPDLVLTWESDQEKWSLWKMYFQMALWIGVVLALLLKTKAELGGRKKGRNIRAEFDKRLKKIYRSIDAGSWREVGTEATNLIYFVLGEISGQRGANQAIEKLLDLAPPSVRRELGSELKRHIEVFQIVGFAPEAIVGRYKETGVLKKELASTVKTLEKALRIEGKKQT